MTKKNYLSQQEFAETFESMHEGIAVFNAQDEMTYFNRSFAVLHKEISSILAIGTPWPLLLNEAQNAGIGAGLTKADLHLNSLGSHHFKFDEERKRNTWVTIGVNTKAKGGFIVSVRDVSETYAVTQMQNERENLIREVLDACDACVAMTEVGSGRFLYRTPADLALFGNKQNAKSTFSEADQRSDFLAALLPTREISDFPATLLNKAGQQFPARISARLVNYLGEDVIVSTTRDMSLIVKQRKEIALRRANEFQSEKLRAMGELLAGVAHELNNPLSVAAGQTLMLKEEVRQKPLISRIEKIDKAVSRCAKIVRTFLSMARQKPANIKSCSFNLVCETALDVVAFAGMIEGCEVIKDLDQNIPEVQADEDQIIQVLVNLITNALQAMETVSEPRKLKISTHHNDAMDMVTCTVQDTGPGISQQIKARAFEPYFTTKPVGKGTGIGLAFSHRVIESHNGEIVFDDDVEDGTKISVSLNVARNVNPDDSDHNAPIAMVIGGKQSDITTITAILKSMHLRVACFSTLDAAQAGAISESKPELAFVCLDHISADPSTFKNRARKTGLLRNADLVFFSEKIKIEEKEMLELENNINVLEAPFNVRGLRNFITQRINELRGGE